MATFGTNKYYKKKIIYEGDTYECRGNFEVM